MEISNMNEFKLAQKFDSSYLNINKLKEKLRFQTLVA